VDTWISTILGVAYSSSSFPSRTSGLLPFKIILELWILQTVVRTPWTDDQPCRKAATYTGRNKRKKKRGLISIHRVRFKPRILVFELAKTFHVSDRAVTVIG
jgi:hypothetical protein